MPSARVSSALLAAAVMALALTGCGNLIVKVDVLNPQIIEQEIDRLVLRDALPAVLAQTDDNLRDFFASWQAEHRRFYVDLKQEYLRRAAAEPTAQGKAELTAAASVLEDDFDKQIVPYYQRAEADVKALNAQARTLDAARGKWGAAGRTATADLARVLRQRSERLRGFDELVRRNTNGQVKRLEARGGRVPQRIKDAAAATNNAGASLTQGRDLLDSPYAFAVAGAREKNWSRYYNQTIGTGQLGNFDLAIKMVSLGDFTIKGLMFDPSDVARAVSRVAVQSLVLAAQMSGVPVKMPPPTGGAPSVGGEALAQSSSQLATAQEAAARAEAKLQNYRDALVLIAQAIVSERSSIAGSPVQRKAATEAIKASFDAHKSRLHIAEGQ